jgi:hypothetical protein
MRTLKSVYITKETSDRFKNYCKSNGLTMNFVLDKIVTEWLDNIEEK